MSAVPPLHFAYEHRVPGSNELVCYFSMLSPEALKVKHGLRTEAILGRAKDKSQPVDAANFEPNPAFLQFLHWVMAKHAAGCPGLVAAAKRQGVGHVYIFDGRAPASGAVPPEDVIGAVEVRGGAIVRYRSATDYRILTQHGFPRLDDYFRPKLLAELLALPAVPA